MRSEEQQGLARERIVTMAEEQAIVIPPEEEYDADHLDDLIADEGELERDLVSDGSNRRNIAVADDDDDDDYADDVE